MRRHLLLIIIVISVLVRGIVAIELGDNANPISGAADQFSYHTLAQSVVQGHGFAFPRPWYPFFKPPYEPTAQWSYLYTLYLAGVYALADHHPLAARLIQVLLSSPNVWLVYRIGKRLFGDWAGLAGAALTACYAYLIFFDAALMTQTFYILTVLAAMELSLALVENPTRRGWFLLGIGIGIGTLMRQTMLLFAPILVAWIVWTNRLRTRWSDLLISLTTVALFILPWTIYNYVTFHDFLLLNSNGGYWLYSSNHPNQGTNFDPNYVAAIPPNLQNLSEPALDRALYGQAIGFILADPARFLLLSINRLKDYFWFVPSAQSSLISNLARLFSFALYAPFIVYGLYLSRRQWRECMPLYLFVAFNAILSLFSWAAPRYRLPSDAVLMAFAGLAVVKLAARAKLIPRAEQSSSTG